MLEFFSFSGTEESDVINRVVGVWGWSERVVVKGGGWGGGGGCNSFELQVTGRVTVRTNPLLSVALSVVLNLVALPGRQHHYTQQALPQCVTTHVVVVQR